MLRLNIYSLMTSANNLTRLGEAIGQARVAGRKFDMSASKYTESSGVVLRDIAASIAMPVTAAAARKLLKCLADFGSEPVLATEYAARALEDSITDLMNAFREECTARIVVVIPTASAEFFSPDEPLFGEAVSLKFAKVAADIAEAGTCLALERPTACVFHLMRVVEYAVQRLGKKMHVAIDVDKEGWYQITLHVNKAVEALPTATPRQRRVKQAYGAAAAHLNSVRIATRNDVMHPKATYTDEEAQTLFDATKALMQQMAKIV